ncbi:unnamed protein product [Ranitomeya imitator]|uniref:GB1/RHD3-type G domain-containing protein n=1 Tax=Ranitomeya imitator TaxID=111125 RepID=A0ABN9LXF1_9NEOB|nr:unnamed protein product [Ranitomeya imitator]
MAWQHNSQENVDGNTLVLNKEAEKILLEISQPVVVIAIVGKYRTGKSYLMNKLAGSRTGVPSVAIPSSASFNSSTAAFSTSLVLRLHLLMSLNSSPLRYAFIASQITVQEESREAERSAGGQTAVVGAILDCACIPGSRVLLPSPGHVRRFQRYRTAPPASPSLPAASFALGSSIQSKTKGIWMWCVPHPQKSGQTLVLLDTEGLGDVEKGDCKNDAWIFSLAVMLSSSLVFNSLGTIDQQSMEQLQYPKYTSSKTFLFTLKDGLSSSPLV